MASIVKAVAFANNEVAFIAWRLDVDTLSECLGFDITREYLDSAGNVIDRRPLASYVPFKSQHNPRWEAQNTTIWPVQKFTWRDLTLRKRRDGQGRRVENETVRYAIRAVGRWTEGLEKVQPVQESHLDRTTHQVVVHHYEGAPLPLGYLTAPAYTNAIDVTRSRPPFNTTFTNGILSTQFLRKVLNEDGVVKKGELIDHMKKPDDWLRNYLSGDVVLQIKEFFDNRPSGRFIAALYELEDEQLEALIAQYADRLELILSDAGADEDSKKYDTRNQPAREKLRAIANAAGSSFKLHDRMFNGTGHIGHNKFVVHIGDDGEPTAVLTGSTNWTWTGLSGQSNNCTVIEHAGIAEAYQKYWLRLLDDPQPMPQPPTAKATGAEQRDALKTADLVAETFDLGGGAKGQIWFSPNVPGRSEPPSKNAAVPPDLARLFGLMRRARRAIFFLVFYPSQGGINSVVGEAVNLGIKDPSLEVIGAVSAPQAIWGYEQGKKLDDGTKTPSWAPYVFQQSGVSVVRAAALTDKAIAHEIGEFKLDEKLTAQARGAIIHDKVMVIDPQDPENCVVAFGSHNYGYKASYSNDENMVIVEGHQALAHAYAAHVLDIYDHYRFRAVEAEIAAKQSGTKSNFPDTRGWDGFLDTTDGWQSHAGRRLATYFTE